MAVLGKALRVVLVTGFAATLAFDLTSAFTSDVCEVRTVQEIAKSENLFDWCNVRAVCDDGAERSGIVKARGRKERRRRGTDECPNPGELVRWYPWIGTMRWDGPVAGFSFTIAAAIALALG